MNVSVDTNVLIRCVVCDDTRQTRLAINLLAEASQIAVSTACLCEFVWVLRKVYAMDKPDIALAIRDLFNAPNVAMNRPAVEAGLAILEAGGDFADGVMAYEGAWLGGQTFVSFDHEPKRKPRRSRRGQARSSSYGAEGSPDWWRRSSDRKVGVLHKQAVALLTAHRQAARLLA